MLNEHQILDILAKVGDKGLTCKNLARHLYNASNSLFQSASFDDIYRELQMYMIKKSKAKNSYIEKTGRWGYYRLNQEKLKTALGSLFDELEEEPEDEEPKKVTSCNGPSLFD